MLCFKKHDTEIRGLRDQLLQARMEAAAAQAEVKVLRESNARLDDEAKRGMNLLTRGLTGMSFWEDPEKVAAQAVVAAAQEPVTPIANVRDWTREAQRLQDEADKLDKLARGREIIKSMNVNQEVEIK